jgi:hypothetical protein
VAWFAFGDHSVSTAGGGLSRFDGQAWQHFLGDVEVNALAGAPDGSLWAGVGCDVQRFDGEAWETVGRCDEDLPPGSVLDLAFAPAPLPGTGPLSGMGYTVWVAKGQSLARFDGRTWMVYERLANSIVAAPAGTVWINGWEGTQDSFYVARLDGEEWTVYPVADAFPGAFAVRAVMPDGRIWGIVPEWGLAAFAGGSWSDGSSWSFHELPEDLGREYTRILGAARDGALWISGEDGVARLVPPDAAREGEGDSGELWTVYPEAGSATDIAFGPGGEIWFGATRFQP